ncbi:Pul2 [Kluyveromyces marxianus]
MEYYRSNSKNHSKLDSFGAGAFLVALLGECLGFQNGPEWSVRQMSLFQRQFTELTMKQVEISRKMKQEIVVEKLYGYVETGKFTFNNWIQTIDEILFANIEVTSTVMAWALVDMGSNIEEQERLRNEILKIKPNSTVDLIDKQANSLQQYIKRTDTFLQYCVWETLRMHPLLWFSFPEVSSETLFIDGVRILPNTPIVVDQYQINYNSPIWNPSNKPKYFGEKFAPSRFESIKLRDALYSQVTFGAGSRKCLGKNFAELLIKSELVYILSKYRVAILDKIEFSKDTFVVQPKTKIQLTAL